MYQSGQITNQLFLQKQSSQRNRSFVKRGDVRKIGTGVKSEHSEAAGWYTIINMRN